MSTLPVRLLQDGVDQGLKAQVDSGHSMSAEVRDIQANAVRERTWWTMWVEATEHLRGDELPIPPRSMPRGVDLS